MALVSLIVPRSEPTHGALRLPELRLRVQQPACEQLAVAGAGVPRRQVDTRLGGRDRDEPDHRGSSRRSLWQDDSGNETAATTMAVRAACRSTGPTLDESAENANGERRVAATADERPQRRDVERRDRARAGSRRGRRGPARSSSSKRHSTTASGAGRSNRTRMRGEVAAALNHGPAIGSSGGWLERCYGEPSSSSGIARSTLSPRRIRSWSAIQRPATACPPARRTASRTGIAQRCSTRATSRALAGLDRVRHAPLVLVVEDVTVGQLAQAPDGSELHAVLAGRAEADQGADGGTEGERLVRRRGRCAGSPRSRRPRSSARRAGRRGG